MFLKIDNDIKNEDNLKNEDKHKNKDNLKNKEDLKNENYLKNKDDLHIFGMHTVLDISSSAVYLLKGVASTYQLRLEQTVLYLPLTHEHLFTILTFPAVFRYF